MDNMIFSKILIVDDKASNRRSICRIIESMEIFDTIDTVQADSGESALQILLTETFALILLDVSMPGMSGYETARIISDDQFLKDIPIIFITAQDSSSQNILTAYQAGATDYISKPIETDILVNKIKTFVALDQARKASHLLGVQRDRILNAAGEGVIEVDAKNIIIYCNHKASLMLNCEVSKIVGSKFTQWFKKYNDNLAKPEVYNFEFFYHTVTKTGLMQIRDIIVETTDNQFIPIEMNCTVAMDVISPPMTLLFQDISQRIELEKQALEIAQSDSLTGLSNRAYFYSTLSRSIKRQHRLDKTLAILFIDLDFFKHINDTYGHDGGDTLLITIAERLSGSVRGGDLVSRIGGDEFAVILYDIENSSDINHIVDGILSSVASPVPLQSCEVNVTVSIGIAFFEDESMTIKNLLKNADSAMYEAKASGRNNYKYFEAEMQEKAKAKQRIQILLSNAISNNELSIVYQPKVSLSSKRMTGCEALLRWSPINNKIPQEILSPAVFIPIAEESGQINAIGDWVLHQVLRQVKKWLTLPGFVDMVVSINVSTKQLVNKAFYTQVEKLIRQYAIPPEMIEFEVTETCMTDNMNQVFHTLHLLHKLGTKISIDDFGTGNSSLDLLRKLPFDIIKIDRSFIKDIGTDQQDEEIIRVVMAIAKTMNMEVIAEGAETLEQLSFLSGIDCELIQGYFFSKPVNSEKITNILSSSALPFIDKFQHYENYISKKHKEIAPSTQLNSIVKSKQDILIYAQQPSDAYFLQNVLLKVGFIVHIALSENEVKNLLTSKTYSVMILDINISNGAEFNIFSKQIRILVNEMIPIIVVAPHIQQNILKHTSNQSLPLIEWIKKPLEVSKLLSLMNKFITPPAIRKQNIN